MICEFCNKKLSNNYSLKRHQKSVQSCLEKQGKNIQKFKCNFCLKFFVNLNKHSLSCKNKNSDINNLVRENLILKQKITELEENNFKLQSKYDNIVTILASKPTTTNNTTNNLNLIVFDKSDEDINKIVNEKYDRNYLMDGQKGVAKFTHEHILKSSNGEVYMVCDISRGHGKYKISATETVIDPEMKSLSRKIHPSVKQKAIKIAEKNIVKYPCIQDGYEDVCKMDKNNASFRKELVSLILDKETHILGTKNGFQFLVVD